ncbi:MMPL family transporter [soil metagenome]
MFDRLGRVVYRGRRAVLAAALIFLAFAGVWGTGAFGALSSGGFEDPTSESVRAQEVIDEALGRSGADLVVLYRSAEATVDNPAYEEAVTETLAALPADSVAAIQTFWSTGSPDLVSEDRRSTYAVVQLTGADQGEREAQFVDLEADLAAPGVQEQIGGLVAVNRDITEQVSADIARAEMISLPILFVLLLVIFGGVVAASLPLLIGVVAILGSFTAIRVITGFTEVSTFAINIVIFLGLGLAIDYGLFMVSRFREEMARGRTVPEAVVRTMGTAGRTVAVSGITVAIAMAGLTLFPQNFLRSMGYGGIAAVLVAMTAALTLLPALLAMLGHRVDALSVRPLLRRVAPWAFRHHAADEGVWYRIAHSVMRRPVVYLVVIVLGLLVLAAPFLRISFGGVDERALPADSPGRVVAESLERDFGGAETAPAVLAVTLPAPADQPAGSAALGTYVERVREVPGVEGAEVTGTAGDTASIALSYAGDVISPESREIVERVRAVTPPEGVQALVGGETAALVDLLASIGDTLPWMALIVVAATFVLLFLAFGSVLLPIKAVLMNVLSLGATFGALVWIFQDGNLSGVLGFTSTGTIEATQPILILAIAFGLSMDYEVFLLSRVREQYDLTGDNTEAVATGLQRTGSIITSAALLLVVVIGAFSTSGITFIKLIGVAMIIAIIVDATIVRALLVPATMRLLGRANWWAPAPLRRFYERYGIHEEARPDLTGRGTAPGPRVPADASEPPEDRPVRRRQSVAAGRD